MQTAKPNSRSNVYDHLNNIVILYMDFYSECGLIYTKNTFEIFSWPNNQTV